MLISELILLLPLPAQQPVEYALAWEFRQNKCRVGMGPFPSEMTGDTAEKLQKVGKEFGATTGRQRRVGWFDAMIGKYAVMINGIDSIALTKLDVLTTVEKLRICVAYKYKGSVIKNF